MLKSYLFIGYLHKANVTDISMEDNCLTAWTVKNGQMATAKRLTRGIVCPHYHISSYILRFSNTSFVVLEDFQLMVQSGPPKVSFL